MNGLVNEGSDIGQGTLLIRTIESEIKKVCAMILKSYELFGFDEVRIALSIIGTALGSQGEI